MIAVNTDASLREDLARAGIAYTGSFRRVVAQMLAAHPGWQLKQIRRSQNVQANILARRALKLENAGPVQRRHLERAERQEAAAA